MNDMFFQHEIDFLKSINLSKITKHTPILVINSKNLIETLNKFKNINKGQIYYQVKQNSNQEVLKLLSEHGAHFDCQSLHEIQLVRSISSKCNISFGNIVKKKEEIHEQYSLYGVRRFVADSEMEIEKIQTYAPHSEVYIRLFVDFSDKSRWSLSRKFGASFNQQIALSSYQKEKQLDVIGVSFHVGSQNLYPETFEKQIYYAKCFFDEVYKNYKIRLKMLNIGGGFPAHHMDETEIPVLEKYIEVINNSIDKYLSLYDIEEVMVEPARGLIGDQGFLFTKVLLRKHFYNVVNKSITEYLFLDTGVFHGLFESIGGIKYRVQKFSDILNNTQDIIMQEYVLQGSSCDSIDIIGTYSLNVDITMDDILVFASTGQYTTAYATNFNGLQSPHTIVI